MLGIKKTCTKKGCRSPRGERGLKLLINPHAYKFAWSLPTRGAWIEIIKIYRLGMHKLVAPHAGSVD